MSRDYSVYGLLIGTGASWVPTGIMPLWRSEERRAEAVPVPIWAIQRNGRTIVVDTAFDRALTGDAWASNFSYRPQAEALREIGVDIDEVETVILTHLHLDHATGLDHFPRARFIMQRSEYEFWTGPMSAYPPIARMCPAAVVQRLRSLHAEGRLVFLDGDHELQPGLRLVAVGGHTPGMQMVAIDTSKGTLVLCSDVAYVYENIAQRWPIGLYHDFAATILALERALTIASSDSLAVPNHDIQLWRKEPVVQLV
ncbi:MAG: N-acyl homoserine lactonase family protein [Candidatus Tectomicrobia bacterium]|nr:N-acyl homoserine lactonase family protein [Candidatus Tectomicrobia bacterium]